MPQDSTHLGSKSPSSHGKFQPVALLRSQPTAELRAKLVRKRPAVEGQSFQNERLWSQAWGALSPEPRVKSKLLACHSLGCWPPGRASASRACSPGPGLGSLSRSRVEGLSTGPLSWADPGTAATALAARGAFAGRGVWGRGAKARQGGHLPRPGCAACPEQAQGGSRKRRGLTWSPRQRTRARASR